MGFGAQISPHKRASSDRPIADEMPTCQDQSAPWNPDTSDTFRLAGNTRNVLATNRSSARSVFFRPTRG